MQTGTERAPWIGQLVVGLGQRRSRVGGAGLEELDAELVQLLRRCRGVLRREPRVNASRVPPRDVSIPLALALCSQPHVARTFLDRRGRSTAVAERPVYFEPEVVSSALGLKTFEVDDLRGDVDRRASIHLKQQRCARWLMDQWGARPSELFQRLFPGAPEVPGVRTERRGSQLYVFVNPPVPASSVTVQIPWLHDGDDGLLPLDAFAGRYVEAGLRESIGRGIGASPDEVRILLDRMITLVPHRQARDWLHQDQWRSTGAAAVTGLAASYAQGHRLDVPLGPEDVSLEGWVKVREGSIRLGNAEAAFDQMALRRTAAVVRVVSGALLSRVWLDDRSFSGADLGMFDAMAHLRTVVEPIIAWTGSSASNAAAARQLGVEPPHVVPVLERIRERFKARAARWLRAPTPSDPWPPSARMVDFLVRLASNVGVLLDQSEQGQPQRAVMILHAAFRVSEAADAELVPIDPYVDGLPEQLTSEVWSAWTRLFDPDAGAPETWAGIG